MYNKLKNFPKYESSCKTLVKKYDTSNALQLKTAVL